MYVHFRQLLLSSNSQTTYKHSIHSAQSSIHKSELLKIPLCKLRRAASHPNNSHAHNMYCASSTCYMYYSCCYHKISLCQNVVSDQFKAYYYCSNIAYNANQNYYSSTHRRTKNERIAFGCSIDLIQLYLKWPFTLFITIDYFMLYAFICNNPLRSVLRAVDGCWLLFNEIAFHVVTR